MNTGVLLLDKPSGITSAQCVAAARRRLGQKKIGHAGTLDPMATGLLVLLVGGATRVASYAESGRKRYSGSIRLGGTADTDDVTGVITASGAPIPDFHIIEDYCRRFTGMIEQVPPQVSAVKIDGKRAYQRVRRGEVVDIKPRSVEVSRFDVFPGGVDNSIRFIIECSKGTYIRSIARDLGAVLGCGGMLETLRREASYPFEVSEGCSLEAIAPDQVLPWTQLFPHVTRLRLDQDDAARLLSGDTRRLPHLMHAVGDTIALYGDTDGTPLGLLVRSGDDWQIGVNVQ